MARLSRLVVPGMPHHVTQRGNRRETVFFDDDDYRAYIGMLRESVAASGSELWAWCLMPNHVHMIIVPSHEDGLRQCVANAHRKYSRRINTRNQWTGHLWQGRFGSVVMDEAHLYNAIAYVTLNPVRARLVDQAQDWKWSSVHAHLSGRADGMTMIAPVLNRTGDFKTYLGYNFGDEEYEALRRAEIVGRPIGSDAFLKTLEDMTGRTLCAGKRGPKDNTQSE